MKRPTWKGLAKKKGQMAECTEMVGFSIGSQGSNSSKDSLKGVQRLPRMRRTRNARASNWHGSFISFQLRTCFVLLFLLELGFVYVLVL